MFALHTLQVSQATRVTASAVAAGARSRRKSSVARRPPTDAHRMHPRHPTQRISASTRVKGCTRARTYSIETRGGFRASTLRRAAKGVRRGREKGEWTLFREHYHRMFKEGRGNDGRREDKPTTESSRTDDIQVEKESRQLFSENDFIFISEKKLFPFDHLSLFHAFPFVFDF